MNKDTEELLTFPCDYPIKIVGKATADFENAVRALLHQHVPDLQDSAITTRPSGNGNYLAISAILHAQSKAQLDALYIDLTSCKDVIMAL